jgi:hypothetical protein
MGKLYLVEKVYADIDQTDVSMRWRGKESESKYKQIFY